MINKFTLGMCWFQRFAIKTKVSTIETKTGYTIVKFSYL